MIDSLLLIQQNASWWEEIVPGIFDRQVSGLNFLVWSAQLKKLAVHTEVY